MPKLTKDHDLVRAKMLAGLPEQDAIEVAERQLAHDEALAAAAKKESEAKAKK